MRALWPIRFVSRKHDRGAHPRAIGVPDDRSRDERIGAMTTLSLELLASFRCELGHELGIDAERAGFYNDVRQAEHAEVALALASMDGNHYLLRLGNRRAYQHILRAARHTQAEPR